MLALVKLWKILESLVRLATDMKMVAFNGFLIHFCIGLMLSVIESEAIGQSAGRGNGLGEYGPESFPPKPYSFNYEVTDEHGNVHFHREQGDHSGSITGTYGYTNTNGLFRSVEYIADNTGYKAKVKTNEPGTKGPGSADVDLKMDPVPQGLQDVFERKAPLPMMPTAPRPSYRGMKG